MEKIKNFYNKNYKKLVAIPVLLFFLALGYLFYFYFQTGDFFYKDVSLKGGTTISLFFDLNEKALEPELKKITSDLEIKTLTDNTGKKISIILVIPEEKKEEVINFLEEKIGQKLTQENSSIETTSSSLSKNFQKQLIYSLIIAFFFMSLVVFIIFAKNKKIKILSVFLTIFLLIFIRFSLHNTNLLLKLAIFFLAFFLAYFYFKFSISSFAVLFAAASDIILTLSLVNLLEIKLSTGGIVAFLMLLGYSVDTNILLTTRVFKRKKTSVNREIFNAFKTGISMTLTSIFALVFALIFVYRFQSVLNQIFSILIIGLCFDLINTWIFNASLLKFFTEKNENHI